MVNGKFGSIASVGTANRHCNTQERQDPEIAVSMSMPLKRLLVTGVDLYLKLSAEKVLFHAGSAEYFHLFSSMGLSTFLQA